MKAPLVGNRLVLAGAVLYLLEWVAIIAGHVDAPLGAGASATAVHHSYLGHADSLGWAAGWFAVVLFGRVVLMVGVRRALTDSGRRDVLADLAVVAMGISVVLEVAVYAVVAGASWSVQSGGLGTTRSLDAVAFVLNEMVFGTLGVSVLCAGLAMWRSALFPRVLPALGVASGVAAVVASLALGAPRTADVAEGVTSVAALLFWIWMLWTGVLAWRAAPHATAARDQVAAH